ncbi:HK97 family phage prohead protease [uncultured Aeromicrobium sp.]|uniref:HK97 family phage prohead protease n=1 Tax=uncultured Aeromicrobium sp. TaxID=337820 RepID=UPI0025E0A4A0|nr:HK97 family phage prohead protease [uncultured Aeromicrobium sp.]
MTITIPTQTEKRVFTGARIETRAEQVNGYTFLHGRAVPYDTPADIGWFLEEHAPGSLAKSIKEAARALPLLLFHDSHAFPIGRADKWEDSELALDGIWKLDNSEEAQRAAQLAEDEMLAHMSIGFAPIRSQWTFVEDWNPEIGVEGKDRVRRTESRLLEVSLVSTPAFKDAAVTLVRSHDHGRPHPGTGKRQVDAWRKQLEELRR